jgi:hypothetical protein
MADGSEHIDLGRPAIAVTGDAISRSQSQSSDPAEHRFKLGSRGAPTAFTFGTVALTALGCRTPEIGDISFTNHEFENEHLDATVQS